MNLDYLVTGGVIRISRTAYAREILRKDSVLRVLFLQKDLRGHPGIAQEGDGVVISFSFFSGGSLTENPADLCRELKNRYGSAVSGMLYFKSVYHTFRQEFPQEFCLD